VLVHDEVSVGVLLGGATGGGVGQDNLKLIAVDVLDRKLESPGDPRTDLTSYKRSREVS